jgi:palmitoyltransferase
MFIPVGLFVFHIYLVVTNQTSWEVTKRSKISYLKDLPESVFPFDEGIMKNTAEFWCINKDKVWEISSENVRYQMRQPNSNIWNNEYYSCC